MKSGAAWVTLDLSLSGQLIFPAVVSSSALGAGVLQPPEFPADPMCKGSCVGTAAGICISQQQVQHSLHHIVPWAKKPFGKFMCKE